MGVVAPPVGIRIDIRPVPAGIDRVFANYDEVAPHPNVRVKEVAVLGAALQECCGRNGGIILIHQPDHCGGIPRESGGHGSIVGRPRVEFLPIVPAEDVPPEFILSGTETQPALLRPEGLVVVHQQDFLL